jgi:hypothetical protein
MAVPIARATVEGVMTAKTMPAFRNAFWSLNRWRLFGAIPSVHTMTRVQCRAAISL